MWPFSKKKPEPLTVITRTQEEQIKMEHCSKCFVYMHFRQWKEANRKTEPLWNWNWTVDGIARYDEIYHETVIKTECCVCHLLVDGRFGELNFETDRDGTDYIGKRIERNRRMGRMGLELYM